MESDVLSVLPALPPPSCTSTFGSFFPLWRCFKYSFPLFRQSFSSEMGKGRIVYTCQGGPTSPSPGVQGRHLEWSHLYVVGSGRLGLCLDEHRNHMAQGWAPGATYFMYWRWWGGLRQSIALQPQFFLIFMLLWISREMRARCFWYLYP